MQVRATNDEGTGEWSDSGTGSTDPNSAPRLTDGEPIEEELLSATLTAARFLNVRSGYSRAHSAGSLTDRDLRIRRHDVFHQFFLLLYSHSSTST